MAVRWQAARLCALLAALLPASAAASCTDGADTCSAVLARDELEQKPEYVQLLQQSVLINRAENRIAPPQPAAGAAAAELPEPGAAAAAVPAAAVPAAAPAALLSKAVVEALGADAARKQSPEAETETTTTKRTGTTTTTPSPTGMSLNAEGDLSAFVASTATNLATWSFCIGAFCVLRVKFPRMYSNNVIIGTAPSKPDITAHFSWIKACFCYTLEEAIESVGLDHAMLLEFTHLCMKICLIIGLPMVLVMAPLHALCGGKVAGGDHLSVFSFGNVENGSWLYWVHALVVWGVVFTVQVSIYQAQRVFLGHRYTWLRSMADLRANTVMVEGIPDEHQSDVALKKFFDVIFPGGKVKAAYIAKDSKGLAKMVADLEKAKMQLAEAQFHEKKDPSNPPMMRESVMGARVTCVQHWTKEIQELEPKIEELRKKVKEDAAAHVGATGGNCANGFVTFNERSDAELALRLDGVTQDDEEFVISTPPMPNDILWSDLTQDVNAEEGRTVTGYLLIAGLYFVYMPAVIGMTNIAKGIDLGPLQPFWAGLAPTFGLTIMVSFLPTFLKMIFESFFTLKAAAWAQQNLQIWYFWFQVVFVILATAVGQDTAGFTNALLTNPEKIFLQVADTMPYATHFYMNFMVLQSVTHAMNILRYINLTKYLAFRGVFEDEDAAKMAEPEDQDYYGMGSRSARWTINMCVGIVFGTLCPPMLILCFLNFACCRLIYGYLMPYAETRKADLGGPFWVCQLKHLFYGNMIYVVLMSSVLLQRSDSYGPAIISGASIIYVVWSRARFVSAFNWEKLPFQELMRQEDKDKSNRTEKRAIQGQYLQPELYPEAAQ